MKKLTITDAISDALVLEMARDERIFIAGEDMRAGGNFGELTGVMQQFPDRVYDTPISETAIVGLGLGSALSGEHPIVNLSFMDFVMVSMDELCNQVAKFRYMNGGKIDIPLVIYTYVTAGMSAAAQHSQSLEALFNHIPGLQLVFPSNPADAKGLMTSAIRSKNPVMFVLYQGINGTKGDVPEGEYLVPIGKANVVREGTDMTIISYGRSLLESVKAAEKLQAEGISAEVIDLRTTTPLDKDTIIASVSKTGKALVAHEAVRQSGLGAEIAAMLGEECFNELKAPVLRLGAPFCPEPFSNVLEKAYLIDETNIYEEAKKLAAWS